MTPFLAATFLALLAGGALVLVWREHRPLFARALAAVIALAALVAGYAWWVSHGYELQGDPTLVALADLDLEPVAGSYRLRGSATNRSTELAVSAVPVHLRVEDCTPAGCTVLIDESLPLAISLAPGERRQFVLVYNARPQDPHGTLRWKVANGSPKTHQPVLR